MKIARWWSPVLCTRQKWSGRISLHANYSCTPPFLFPPFLQVKYCMGSGFPMGTEGQKQKHNTQLPAAWWNLYNVPGYIWWHCCCKLIQILNSQGVNFESWLIVSHCVLLFIIVLICGIISSYDVFRNKRTLGFESDTDVEYSFFPQQQL